MNGTIDVVHDNIKIKIQCLETIQSILAQAGASMRGDMCGELASLRETYEIETVHILAEYFSLACSIDCADKQQLVHRRDKYNKEFHAFITQSNITGKLDRIYEYLRTVASCCDADMFSELRAYFMKYDNNVIVLTQEHTQFGMCRTCNKSMVIVPQDSQIVCYGCGVAEVLSGTVFDYDQFYYQEGQRTKHNSYDPAKHCRFWIERIQARESKEIPAGVIEDVKECMRRNKIKNAEEISCSEIRRYLRQTKNSSYNEHIPLIRKIITGMTPPQLSEQEVRTILETFSRVIKVYEEIKPSNKTNVPYHPYIIYKIIEHMMDENGMRRRAREILACIHLQASDTLRENDKTWRMICSHLPDLEYKPTSR